MQKSQPILIGIAALLLGLTALGIKYVQDTPQLGKPGVKLVNVPMFDETTNQISDVSVGLPEFVPGYESKPLPISLIELGWLPKDTTYGRRQYLSADSFPIMTTVVLMGSDSRSIHKPQICLPGQGWTIEKSELEQVIIENRVLPLMKLTAHKDIKNDQGVTETWKTLFVYWFVADRKVTAKHTERMWEMTKGVFQTGKLQRWAYVATQGYCRPGGEEATFARIKEFLQKATPEFLENLEETLPPARTQTAALSQPSNEPFAIQR